MKVPAFKAFFGVCFVALFTACAPPQHTWPRIVPQHTQPSFQQAVDAYLSGEDRKAADTCRKIESEILRALDVALHNSTLDGSPEDAETTRQILAEHLADEAAPLRLVRQRFALEPATSRLCGDAAMRANADEDAARWLQDAAVQEGATVQDTLKVVEISIRRANHTLAIELLESVDPSTLAPADKVAYERLRYTLSR